MVSPPGPHPDGDDPADQPLPPRLTPRDHEVLVLLVQGRTNAEIADRLSLSPFTVRDRVSALLRAFQARNRMELSAKVLEWRRRNHRRLRG